jgi:hypothetical protein
MQENTKQCELRILLKKKKTILSSKQISLTCVAAVIKFDALMSVQFNFNSIQFQFQFQFHFQFFLLKGKKLKGVTFTLNENQK